MAAKRKGRNDKPGTRKVQKSLDRDELLERRRSSVPTLPGWPARIQAAQEVTHYTTRDGRVLARVRYGEEPGIGDVASKPCYDCAVRKGQYHVPSCGLERCPNCGGQYWTCECDFMGDEGDHEDFGTADEYLRSFEKMRRKGIADDHLSLLRAHYAAPNHTATWVELASAIGAASGTTVNRQYARLAESIGQQLGIDSPPLDDWTHILVMWAADRDPKGGTGPRTRTPYVLRRPVIEALQRLGLLPRRRKKTK